MLKKLSKNNLSNAQAGWNEAIAEAEGQIGDALRRVRRLKVAIRTIKELRDEGAVLPCTEILAEGNSESVN